MFQRSFLVWLFCCVVFACDDGAGYDGDYAQGGSSASESCDVGSVYACVTSNGQDGFRYCDASTKTFGTCIVETVPKSTTGGTSSIVTTSVSRGGVSVVATGGVASVSVSTGGKTSVIVSATGGTTSVSTPVNSLVDMDGDGAYANASVDRDCNDFNSLISPYRQEVCDNGIDDDCDAKQDCTDPDCAWSVSCEVSTEDVDGDGEFASTDCNDHDATVHHGATEVCWNGKDDDCDAMQDCTDPDCSC